jgi:hypothetical protein
MVSLLTGADPSGRTGRMCDPLEWFKNFYKHIHVSNDRLFVKKFTDSSLLSCQLTAIYDVFVIELPSSMVFVTQSR